MRIATIVGARPQYIKLAPLHRELQRRRVDHKVINSGQHYDYEMAGVFFRELSLPRPAVNLAVGSSDAASMTSRILEKCAVALKKLSPDLVVVIGDTNTTLGGALAAVQLGLPLAHVEAGLRCFDLRTPEELNRIVTDRISSLHLCPTPQSVENLRAEGIRKSVFLTGDLLYDVLSQLVPAPKVVATAIETHGMKPGEYYLVTLHRAESVDRREVLQAMVRQIGRLPGDVVFPVHPRTLKQLRRNGLISRLQRNKRLKLIEPVGYREMLALLAGCKMLLTDSGGLQREAYFLKKPTLLLRDVTEWVEIVANGGSMIVGANTGALQRGLARARFSFDNRSICRKGAARRIADRIVAAFA